MGSVDVVLTVSEGAARAMQALAREALEKRIDALRDAAILAYKSARDLALVEARDEFRLEALALVESDLVGIHRDLLCVVPPIEEEAAPPPAAVEEAT